MAQIPGTVPVAGQIAPTDDLDTYPSHDSIWGKGGTRSVADLTARDAITTERRTEGMMAYVISNQTVYQLVGGILNANWQVFGGGSSGMLEGPGNPNGVVTGIYGQSYRDTATDALYKCTSNPSGTVWLVI